MKLYHYTTIDTLALILSNKTIRFTRLDQLDDLNEVGIYGSNITKTTFVSCWTNKEEESIAQWSIYRGNNRGVFFSLDSTNIHFPDPALIIENQGLDYVVSSHLTNYNEPTAININTISKFL